MSASNAITLQTGTTTLPTVFTARPKARVRMRDFFSSHIRNPNTRRAYREAVRQFSSFCAQLRVVDLAQVEPIHVAAFVEAQLKLHSKEPCCNNQARAGTSELLPCRRRQAG